MKHYILQLLNGEIVDLYCCKRGGIWEGWLQIKKGNRCIVNVRKVVFV